MINTKKKGLYMKKLKLTALFLLTLSAYGCSHNKVAVNKITDNKMMAPNIRD